MNLGEISGRDSKGKDMADSKDRELEGIDSDGERTELEEDDILGQEDPESVNNDL